MCRSFAGSSFIGSAMSRFCLVAGAVSIAAGLMAGVCYGWSCPGSEAETNSNGNYPLGMPMGGIGGGNWNFLPSGLSNTTYCRVTASAGVPPRCYFYQNRKGNASSPYGDTLLHKGKVTSVFTGYWPTVWETYQDSLGMFDSISLECFSPIITGDGIANDNMYASLPLAIYIFTITNYSSSYDTAAIALWDSAKTTILHDTVQTWRVVGIRSSAIGVMVDTAKSDPADSITCTGGSNRPAFLTTGLGPNDSAGILAKRVVVKPNSRRTITFAVAWTSVAAGYYRNYFTDAQALANWGRDSAAILESKVTRWHNKILNSNLPSWLQDLSINSLHVYNSMTDWTTATTSGVTGTYGMAESMSSGNYGTNDQAYHAHFALSLFAPQAEWSQLARMGACENSSGIFYHLYGNSDGLRTCEAQKFTMELLKTYQWTGNTAYLTLMYPIVKLAISGCRSENTRDASGLMQDSTLISYDNPYWDGWEAPAYEFTNELYLAALKAAVPAALLSGQAADTARYDTLWNLVHTSFEKPISTTAGGGFWDSVDVGAQGKTGYYAASTNVNCSPGSGGAQIGRAVWDGGMMGQWCADVCGFGPLHPESRIESMVKFANDACFDNYNYPPVYTLMMSCPSTNTYSTSSAVGNYFNIYMPGSSESNKYTEYCSYGPAEMCTAFYHNCADVAMRGLHAFWNQMFSKYLRVFNMPCKLTIGGAGIDWGLDRYMNPPGVFGAIFGITGFTIDVNAQTFRIKPSLPTSAHYMIGNGDSLIGGPLINPISCGTVDYRMSSTAYPNAQSFVIRFDNPMQFQTFYTKKMYSQVVTVKKPAVGGASIPATIAVNSADSSEYAVTFGSPLTIDSSGVLIIVGTASQGTRYAPSPAERLKFVVDAKRGIISYLLPQREMVTISLVNSKGERLMFSRGEENAGVHVVPYDGKKIASGLYFVKFTAGAAKIVQKVVAIK